MEPVQFVDLNAATVFLLVLIGFIGGMVSGFIGSGGAFVLTPAMMSLGAPAIVAVASNICHKFPKALVGAAKRHKYGQVDVKLGVVLGVGLDLPQLAARHNARLGARLRARPRVDAPETDGPFTRVLGARGVDVPELQGGPALASAPCPRSA